MLPQTIRHALQEIASETQRPYSVVERVFQLCLEAAEYGVSFVVTDGKLGAVSHDDERVPHHLLDAANAISADMIELSDRVSLLGLRLVGRSTH